MKKLQELKNMKATFENSVDVLVKAYLNDTLKHGDCSACAVGNLLNGEILWNRLFITPSNEREVRPQVICQEGEFVGQTFGVIGTRLIQELTTPGVADEIREQIKKGKEAIAASGYSIEQLAKIEYAFESADGYPKHLSADEKMVDDTWMFNGLMAVVDVLAEIHGVDLSVKENAIGQFKEVQLTKI